MSHIWNKTFDVTEAMIGTLLKTQFSLSVKESILLGEGFDNSAFLINDEYVFRFPHRKEGFICMQNEISLLPHFKHNLSFPLPELVFMGKPTEQYPYPFSGYKILPGKLLTQYQLPLVSKSEFASTLGKWLKELHALPVDKKHLTVIQGEHDWRLDIPHRTQRVSETLVKYGDYFEKAGFIPSQLNKMMASFNNLFIQRDNFCYVHGDLYAKHVLVNENGMPAGLIDWGDTHIGHPAIDLALGIMIFDKNALRHFLDSYANSDENIFRVAVFRAFNHSIIAFSYFFEIQDESAIKWTKAALENAMIYVENINNGSK